MTTAEFVVLLILTLSLEAGIFLTPEGTAPPWALATLVPLFWLQLVLIMFWTYRANRCLEDRLHHELETSAVFAGFSYVIPILSLWKPYLAVREIYKASRSPDTWHEDGQASIVGWWWATWLASAALGLAVKIGIIYMATSFGAANPYLGTGLRVVLLIKYVLQFLIVMRVMNWLRRGGVRKSVEEVF